MNRVKAVIEGLKWLGKKIFGKKKPAKPADAKKKADDAGDATAKWKTCTGNCKRKIEFDDKQLQKKYKHAKDFGVDGPYNKQNADKFREAITNHVNSPGTQLINGTYRGNPATFYLNSQTGLNVIQSPSGQFVSGWSLGPGQLRSVLQSGALN